MIVKANEVFTNDGTGKKAYEFLYVVSYFDGRISGYKYKVETLNTDYMSFVASVGTIFYTTLEEAQEEAKRLNRNQLIQLELEGESLNSREYKSVFDEAVSLLNSDGGYTIAEAVSEAILDVKENR